MLTVTSKRKIFSSQLKELYIFGIDSTTNKATKHIPPKDMTRTNQEEYFQKTFGCSVDRYLLHDNLEDIQYDPEEEVMS